LFTLIVTMECVEFFLHIKLDENGIKVKNMRTQCLKSRDSKLDSVKWLPSKLRKGDGEETELLWRSEMGRDGAAAEIGDGLQRNYFWFDLDFGVK